MDSYHLEHKHYWTIERHQYIYCRKTWTPPWSIIWPKWWKGHLSNLDCTKVWFLMSCITIKRVFGRYLLQGGTEYGITGIAIRNPPESDNLFINPTPGYLLWYSMGHTMDRIEEPVLHINIMKLHPRWLANDTFYHPCTPTKDLMYMSVDGGKVTRTNKYITSRTLAALLLLLQYIYEVMGDTRASYSCYPFKSY